MRDAVEHCKTEFEKVRRHRRRTEPQRLSDIRSYALEHFLATGFPSTLWSGAATRFADTIFTMASPPRSLDSVATPHLSSDITCSAELVFVNGYYVPEASHSSRVPHGALVWPLSDVLETRPEAIESFLGHVASCRGQAVVALNTAMFVDGACVCIPPGMASDEAIHVRVVSTGIADAVPAMSNPRLLVVLGEWSRAKVIESYSGPSTTPYLTNAVTEIALADHAALEHVVIQAEGANAYHVATNCVAAGDNSRYSADVRTVGQATYVRATTIGRGGCS